MTKKNRFQYTPVLKRKRQKKNRDAMQYIAIAGNQFSSRTMTRLNAREIGSGQRSSTHTVELNAFLKSLTKPNKKTHYKCLAMCIVPTTDSLQITSLSFTHEQVCEAINQIDCFACSPQNDCLHPDCARIYFRAHLIRLM